MPYKDPIAQAEYYLRWQRENREKRNSIVARYKKKSNNRSFRDSDARRRYGFGSYDEMRSYRNRPCEICGQSANKMCIDHHGPPNVFDQTHRGVLCQQCNTRLGWLERNRKIILDYLERGPRNGSEA